MGTYSQKNDQSLQVETKTAEYSPPKLMIFALVVFIVFIFTRGLMVMDESSNSYSIPYEGPVKSTMERIKEFVK